MSGWVCWIENKQKRGGIGMRHKTREGARAAARRWRNRKHKCRVNERRRVAVRKAGEPRPKWATIATLAACALIWLHPHVVYAQTVQVFHNAQARVIQYVPDPASGIRELSINNVSGWWDGFASSTVSGTVTQQGPSAVWTFPGTVDVGSEIFALGYRCGLAFNGSSQTSSNLVTLTFFDFSTLWLPGPVPVFLNDPNDLDSDCVPDSVDNCLGLANESQLDTDQDGFGNVCDGDFNQSCPNVGPPPNKAVNASDFNLLYACFTGTETDCDDEDMNGSGGVNVSDFNLFNAQLVRGFPGPSALAVCP